MSIFLYSVAGIIGLVLLYYGAELLVKGGVALARKLHIPSLIIGLTLVAFATSAPELVVSIEASLRGAGDISMGNVIGSNICNIALILGLCAMVAPLPVNPHLFRVDMPLMVGSSVLLAFFFWLSGGVNRWEAILLFAGLIAYIGWNVRSARKDPEAAEEAEQDAEMKKAGKRSVPMALFLVLIGILMLIGGAKGLVDSAVYFATLFGVSQAVIALTVVAVGTSLPELATSLVAAIHGERDIAIGNVVGSNIFNILSILGIAPLIAPIHSPGVGWIDMGMMLFCAIALYPIMLTGRKINRGEGTFLFLVYIGYNVYLIIR